MSFKTVIDKVGEDFKIAFTEVQKYLPTASALATVIYPQGKQITSGITTAFDLIQNTVVTIEQKYAAAGTASKTGAAKAADVLAIVGPAVTDLLNKENVPADPVYVNNLISAVVAILNVKAAA